MGLPKTAWMSKEGSSPAWQSASPARGSGLRVSVPLSFDLCRAYEDLCRWAAQRAGEYWVHSRLTIQFMLLDMISLLVYDK